MSVPSERRSESERSYGAGSAGALTRFFGGPPLAVIFRLLLLSIVIGIILEVLGLDPLNIFNSLRNLVQRLWDMGFDAIRWVWRYLLLGAAVVVPIWLIMRFMRMGTGR